MMRVFALSVFAVCAMAVTPVAAQTGGEGPDYQERVALATQMHEIRPSRQQILDAVNNAANRLPAASREEFRTNMMAALDIEELERQSIEAMARTFTKPELERMVSYFGSPEAQEIARKLVIYQSIITPVITRMLDEAIREAQGAPAQ